MVGVVGVVDVGGCTTVPTCCPIPVTWPKTFLKMPIATDLRIAQDRDAFQKQALSTDHNAQEVNLVEGWGCGTFSAIQHSTQTQYVIWDCRRVIADCGVSVRMAWPHLPRNPHGCSERGCVTRARDVRRRSRRYGTYFVFLASSYCLMSDLA
jgi:hypothetical protein